MYAKVNPSGCTERYGLIQTRLDLFLEAGEVRHDDPRFYVIDTSSAAYLKGYTGKLNPDGTPKDAEAYAAWLASLPRIWLAERCFHHHFIYLDPYTLRDEQIEQAILAHLPNFYRAWLDERDHEPGGMRHGWDVATRIRPVRFSLREPEQYGARKALCLSKLPILAASSFVTRASRVGESFPSTDIDVGPGATDRASYQNLVTAGPTYRTFVDANNPANAEGAIDTVETWFYRADAGNSIKIGTFSASGSTFTCRDAQSIGEVASGSKQTDSGLDIAIVTGDCIGLDARAPVASGIEKDTDGFVGHWQAIGQFCDASDSAEFSYSEEEALSIYGTGDTGVTAYNETATLGVGVALAATRVAGFARTAALGLGIAVAATRGFAKIAALALGIAAAAKRGFAFTAALGVGLVVRGYRDIIGQILRVRLAKQDPYKVKTVPNDPYKVEIKPPEDE